MKFTVATVAAVLATGAFAKPIFTNNVINPQEGKPFTLTFSGCAEGCTITLQTGPNSQALDDIRTLTTDATGDSFDVTLSNLDSGTYNFKISNNSDGSDANYSTPFSYAGTVTSASSSSSSMSPTSSSSSGSSKDSSSASSNTSSATSSSDSSSTTESTTSTGSSSSGSATSSSRSNGTTSAQPSSTSSSNAGSATGVSPLGVIGAAAVALYL